MITTPQIQNRIKSGPGFPPPEQLRVYVHGLPGCGKTWFLGSIPNSLLLDIEGEGKFLVAPKSSILTIKDGQDFDDILDWLCDGGPSKTGFQTVSIDTIDAFMGMLFPFLTDRHNNKVKAKYQSESGGGRTIDDIREYGQAGAGWSKINDYVASIFIRIMAAHYGLCVSGHCRESTVEDTGSPTGSRTVIRPSLNPGARDVVYRYSQFCGRIRHGLVTDTIARKNAKGEIISTDVIKTRRFFLDLTTQSSSPTTEAMLKARLVDHLLDPNRKTGADLVSVDITGPDGWGQLIARYQEACERARASTTTITSPQEKKNGNSQ